MNSESHELLWSHYNARGLSPELVAKSFIPPKQFEEVSLPRSTVVLGPRGSGKTTLLRMLDPRALSTWQSEDSARFRNGINYVGAFVPIDAPWILSLRQPYTDRVGVDEDALAVSVYSLALGRSLIDQMIWRTTTAAAGAFKVSLTSKTQRELAEQVAELWLPSERTRSLSELRLQLTREIALTPRKWLEGGDQARQRISTHYANPLELAVATCEMFNHASDEPERVWALLCDELEIAPPAIQRLLFKALRAPSSRLLLKLAFSPALRSPLSLGIHRPATAHDADVVSLSYPTREEGPARKAREEFCKALWHNLLEEKGLEPEAQINSPYSKLEDPRARQAETSRERTRDNFVMLSRVDPSFAYYLKEKKVSLESFEENTPEIFDSVIRKTRPVVEARLHYLRPSDDGVRRASRAAHTPYCGAERLFAMSEGHPRWFKATLGAMLSGADAKGRISLATQTREIELSIARLESRIRAFPVERNASMSTYTFICKVGDFFGEQILGDEFHADPCLSFLVDEAVSEEVLGCIEKALYLGAVIPMQSDSGTVFFDGIQGHRFRLSNWLAPRFRLPLITGKAINLSGILNARGKPSRPPSRSQLDLGLPNGE